MYGPASITDNYVLECIYVKILPKVLPKPLVMRLYASPTCSQTVINSRYIIFFPRLIFITVLMDLIYESSDMFIPLNRYLFPLSDFIISEKHLLTRI